MIKQFIIIKMVNNKKNTQWHTLNSNPSPFNMPKYSQPLKLILFHVIKANINYHKGSLYPHFIN